MFMPKYDEERFNKCFTAISTTVSYTCKKAFPWKYFWHFLSFERKLEDALNPTRNPHWTGWLSTVDLLAQTNSNHRDKPRVQTPAKMFPHLKLLCWLFKGPIWHIVKKQFFVIKFSIFYNKNKIQTILFIVKYEKITL
jgi:hypothetical protein